MALWWFSEGMHRQVVLAVPADEHGCESLAVNHDGTLLAVGRSNGMVGLWDVVAGRAVGHYLHDLLGRPVRAVAFAADGLLLATGGDDKHVKIRNLRTGKVRWRREHPAEVLAVAFDHSGSLVATACADGVLRVWSPAGRVESQVDGGCSARTRSVSFTEDGFFTAADVEATATPDGSLVVLVADGEIRVLRPAA
jgi:WD40 repeat protein